MPGACVAFTCDGVVVACDAGCWLLRGCCVGGGVLLCVDDVAAMAATAASGAPVDVAAAAGFDTAFDTAATGGGGVNCDEDDETEPNDVAALTFVLAPATLPRNPSVDVES